MKNMKKNVLFSILLFGLILLSTSCDDENETPPLNANNTGNSGFVLGTMTDGRDGEVYETITIGNQTWMAENLRYNASQSFFNPASPSSKFGRLYTWDSALNACPSGWHLPSDLEWNILEINLGLDELESMIENNRGTHGEGMKSIEGWTYEEGIGTNTTGFNALPNGYGYLYGPNETVIFSGTGIMSNFWTSTDYSLEKSWTRSMTYLENGVNRHYSRANYDMGIASQSIYIRSCRCVQ